MILSHEKKMAKHFDKCMIQWVPGHKEADWLEQLAGSYE